MNQSIIKTAALIRDCGKSWMRPIALSGILLTLEGEAQGQSPPAIRTQPQSVIAMEDATALLSVTASGTPPLRYQWSREDSVVQDATNRTLRIRSLRDGDPLSYTVVIANDFGAVTSRVVSVVVVPPVSEFEARRYEGTSRPPLPYRLHSPRSPEAGVRFPLILFLHGSLEVGSDNVRPLTAHSDALVFLTNPNQAKHPCYFLVPQCPGDRHWGDPAVQAQLKGMLESLIGEFPVDPNRLYVTGFSFGAWGTWQLAARYPGLFAAVLPMCGGIELTSTQASSLRRLAVWTFHAVDDSDVPVSQSRSAVAALRRAGGRPIYTEFQKGGHFMFKQAYLNPHLVEWVFSQRRAQGPIGPPALDIMNPPAGERVRTAAPTISVSGASLTMGEAVMHVQWTNMLGRIGGAADGTETWTIDELPLRHPGTNVIVVTARTTSWVEEYGGATSFSDTLFVEDPPSPLLEAVVSDGALILRWEISSSWRVQWRQSLVEGDWNDFGPDATSPFNVPTDGLQGYFRLRSEAVAQ